jgi:MFS transporter, DHA1 family, multidrug resistance protein
VRQARPFVAESVSGRVAVIAATAGTGSFATQFWMPFLPFFLLRIGATSDANALFWLALALSGQGIGRILAGPAWGYAADRYGRKIMYVRALYAASVTTVIAGVATAPWHVIVAFTLQGMLSGFIPAAVALTSVSVPRQRLTGSLAIVTAAQYLGTTVGPALGAIFAGILGLRGAIVAGAMLPSIAALVATMFVPRDEVELRPASSEAKLSRRERLRGFASHLSVQLALALFLYFVLYATSNVLRIAAPIAIKQILHGVQATSVVGVAYTASGMGSVIGALALARFVIRPPRVRLSLTAVLLVTAASHLLLALAGSVLLFTAWFTVISMAQGAMIPAANTMIASSVAPAWRGTVFGVASSFQALAFIIGPMSAALFAAFSLPVGFAIVGAFLLLTAGVLATGLREPELGMREAYG